MLVFETRLEAFLLQQLTWVVQVGLVASNNISWVRHCDGCFGVLFVKVALNALIEDVKMLVNDGLSKGEKGTFYLLIA
jgi:hypothetical protein